jgi:hypothetical protein
MPRLVSAFFIICAVAGAAFALVPKPIKQEWVAVSLDNFTLTIPYSPTLIGPPPYEPQPVDGQPGIRFGDLVSAGTFRTREYYLFREERTDLDLLAQLRDGECGHTSLRSIGRVQGVAYMIGGAKGCSSAFAFNEGGHMYVLYRFAEFGAPPAPFGADEEKIIESLREIEPRQKTLGD